MAKLSLEDQVDALARYLPSGRAFGAKGVSGTVLRGLLRGLAGEVERADDLLCLFKLEILPDETTLFLDEWERAVGIPDDCFTGSGTQVERRRDVLAKLASLGVQTEGDFEELAAIFGVTADVIPGAIHGVFPYTFPMVFFPSDKDARFTIIVDVADIPGLGFPYTFPLVFGTSELGIVECLFDKLKPANVDVLFVNFP